MRKRILEGIAGIGLLAVLPACSTQKQAIMPEDVYAVARTVQTGTEQEAGSDKQQGQISRNVEIPQLQVDAQSVYNRMINYIVPEEELAPVLLKEQLAVSMAFICLRRLSGSSVSWKIVCTRLPYFLSDAEIKPCKPSQSSPTQSTETWQVTGSLNCFCR